MTGNSKKNILIMLLLLIPFFAWASDTLHDSYSEANKDNNDLLNNADAGVDCHAHSFTTLNDGKQYKLTSIKAHLAKVSTPTGNYWAVLYAHSGTYGVTSVPTGSALATSDTKDISALTTSYVLTELFFTGSNQYVMSANTNYELAICTDTAENSKYLSVGIDATAATHAGNDSIHVLPATWVVYGAATIDMPFYVYGLENVAASSPRRIPQLIFWQ